MKKGLKKFLAAICLVSCVISSSPIVAKNVSASEVEMQSGVTYDLSLAGHEIFNSNEMDIMPNADLVGTTLKSSQSIKWYPSNNENGWLLLKDSKITFTVNLASSAKIEMGYIFDNTMYKVTTVTSKNPSCTFTTPERGRYCIYITNLSDDTITINGGNIHN